MENRKKRVEPSQVGASGKAPILSRTVLSTQKMEGALFFHAVIVNAKCMYTGTAGSKLHEDHVFSHTFIYLSKCPFFRLIITHIMVAC